MFRTIAKLTACLAQLALALPGQAQRRQAAGTDSESPCAFTLSSGSGNTFLQFCVADAGNITRIETPEGREQVATGGGTDRYSICDADFGPTSYSDYGRVSGDSGNWSSLKPLKQRAIRNLDLSAGLRQSIFIGPNPRNFTAWALGTPILNIDGSIVLAHVGTIGPGQTKTTSMIYKGF